ncbi:hypothetical protein QNI19_15750 [Cytophagaceae bacterium DM2B3-1]|uniref:DUF3829 domain-containing protein n=1 Tax=Xanthocytophaga flava TaxID=3048013 RepID=A0ABT7CL30_9BACT|nr:hypothetical protein [Xanthocytophaga flavus]MDJ1494398.1 hypothetical protein [Xanthocytophaga flavus]
MYKLSLLICVVAFVACTSNSKETNTQTDSTTAGTPSSDSTAVTNPKLSEYVQYLANLNDSTAESATKAAQKFQEIFKGSSPALCDSAFVFFNTFYEKLGTRLDEVHASDTTNYDSLIVDPTAKPVPLSAKLTAYNQKLTQNGFQVAMTEGTTYIKQDRELIAKWFYTMVSPTMKSYLTQLNKENKEGFAEDAGINIPITSLADRVIWWEKFNQTNPTFVFAERSKDLYQNYLFYLLKGMDNTASYYQDEAGKVTPDQEFMNAYTYVLSKHPNTETAKLVKPFQAALAQHDVKKAESLLKQYQDQKIIQ